MVTERLLAGANATTAGGDGGAVRCCQPHGSRFCGHHRRSDRGTNMVGGRIRGAQHVTVLCWSTSGPGNRLAERFASPPTDRPNDRTTTMDAAGKVVKSRTTVRAKRSPRRSLLGKTRTKVDRAGEREIRIWLMATVIQDTLGRTVPSGNSCKRRGEQTCIREGGEFLRRPRCIPCDCFNGMTMFSDRRCLLFVERMIYVRENYFHILCNMFITCLCTDISNVRKSFVRRVNLFGFYWFNSNEIHEYYNWGRTYVCTYVYARVHVTFK